MTTLGVSSNDYRGARNLVLAQACKFGSYLSGLIVLSRLLTPADFGVVAIAISIVGFADYFRDFGLSVAAIREKHLSVDQRDSLCWTNLGLGCGLAIITALASGALAGLFNSPGLSSVMQSLSLVFVINGWATQYRASLNRDRRYSELAIADAVGPVIGLVVAIVLAFLGVGMLSLVLQTLTAALVSASLLVWFGRWFPGRPKMVSGMRKFYAFGGAYAISQVIGYVGNNVDTVALGYFGTPAQVGVYSRAYQMTVGALDQVRSPAMTVALPSLSHVREDILQLQTFILRAQLLLGYLTLPLAAILAGGSRPIVEIVLGSAWSPASAIVVPLALAAVLQQLAVVSSWLFVTMRRGGELRNYMAVSTTLKLACIAVGVGFGPLGVAWAYAAATMLAWPVALVWSCRVAGLNPVPILRQSARLLGFGAGLALAAWGTCSLANGGAPGWGLLGASVGFIAALAASLVFPVFRHDLGAVMTALRRAFSIGRAGKQE